VLLAVSLSEWVLRTRRSQRRDSDTSMSESTDSLRRSLDNRNPARSIPVPNYVALVYEPKDAPRDVQSPDFVGYMQRYIDFGASAGAAIVGGAVLNAEYTATTLHVQGGKGGELVLHDGPYVEAKEMLGGFYIIDAPDLDAALELAAQIPAAWDGGRVEVRPGLSM
jgi:hypothetical protein